jgi:hypothetical protein
MAEIVGILLRQICAASVSSHGFRSKLDDAEVALAGGALLSAKGRGKEGTASGARGVGPWAGSGFGPNRFPWPFSSFPFSFLFFSVFFFVNLQKHFKLIQINF